MSKQASTADVEEEMAPTGLAYQQEEVADFTDEEKGEPTPPEKDIAGLPEDIYSLLTVAPAGSAAFFYSLAVMLFQLIIIMLTLLDLLGTDASMKVDHSNPLRVPPGVNKEVTLAQAFSMILLVASESNFLTALDKMTVQTDHVGVRDAVFRLLGQDIQRKTFQRDLWLCKCSVSIILQLIAGIGMLMVGFVMNMQSTSVLGLMLNFAALQFISDIQDIAFWVARDGYVSLWVEQATQHVKQVQIPCPKRTFDKAYCRQTLVKRVTYLLVTCAVMAGYGVLVHQQTNGRFLCQNLFVQWGDQVRPELPSFTGEYQQHPSQKIHGRVVYYGQWSGARFAYCSSMKVWTFKGGYFQLKFGEGEDSVVERVDPDLDDPCVGYWAKSAETHTFDITETMITAWTVWDMYTNQTHLPIDFMTMYCLDCNANGGRTCSNYGSCNSETNRCDCDFGRFGLNCEYPLPCKSLELDLRTPPFPAVLEKHGKGRSMPTTSFSLLTDDEGIPVVVYNKPVYVNAPKKRKQKAEVSESGNESIALLTATMEEKSEEEQQIEDVLMFLGRRFGLAKSLDANGNRTTPTSRAELVQYLRNERFQAIFSGYDFHMMSSQVDTGTPTDKVTPAEVSWYKTRKWLTLAATDSENSNGNLKGRMDLYRADETQAIDTVLLCRYCQSALNPCINKGYCARQDNTPQFNDGSSDGGAGECQCLPGFSGYLCEHEQSCTDEGATCFYNGTCDALSGDCICPLGYEGRLCQYESSIHTEL
jgi:hypothetical protein